MSVYIYMLILARDKIYISRRSGFGNFGSHPSLPLVSALGKQGSVYFVGGRGVVSISQCFPHFLSPGGHCVHGVLMPRQLASFPPTLLPCFMV